LSLTFTVAKPDPQTVRYTHLIHDAAEENDVARIRDLVAQGAPVDAKSDDGCTGLWLAAAKGKNDAVTALAQLGAEVEAPTKTGTTALFVAALTGHVDTVCELVRLGANVNHARSGDLATPLLASVIGSQFKVMQELV
jgi:ankyrin repeat protein